MNIVFSDRSAHLSAHPVPVLCAFVRLVGVESQKGEVVLRWNRKLFGSELSEITLLKV